MSHVIVQSPAAYDRQNLTGPVLGARLALAAGPAMRGFLRAAIQDTSYRFKIHPAETASGLVEANLNFGFDVGHVLRYGADATGSVDCTTAFNAAFAVCAALPGGGMVTTSGGYFRIDGSLMFTPDLAGFEGNGCLIDASHRTNAHLFVPRRVQLDLASQPGYMASHPLRNFLAIGPGDLVAARFISIEDNERLGDIDLIAGIKIENGGSSNWSEHVWYGDGSFFIAFENWYFDSMSNSSNKSGACAVFSASVNCGERNSFTGCRFANGSRPNIISLNGAGDTHFINCSFNYAQQGFLDNDGGNVYFSHCHFENNNDLVHWFSNSGANSCVFIANCAIAMLGTKTNFAPCYCDASVTAGVFSIENTHFAASSNISVPLVDGAGNVNVKNIAQYQAAQQLAFYAASLNRLKDGGFESGSIAADGWVGAGVTLPAAHNSNPRSGAYSLRLQGLASQANSVSKTVPCSPGQQLSGVFYAAYSGHTAPTQFVAEWHYLDAAGASITGGAIADIRANQGYTRYKISTYVRAPAGTAAVKIQFAIFGTTSGTPLGFVDDVVLNVQ